MTLGRGRDMEAGAAWCFLVGEKDTILTCELLESDGNEGACSVASVFVLVIHLPRAGTAGFISGH